MVKERKEKKVQTGNATSHVQLIIRKVTFLLSYENKLLLKIPLNSLIATTIEQSTTTQIQSAIRHMIWNNY